MNNRTTILATALITGLSTTPVMAEHEPQYLETGDGEQFTDYAKVVRVTPIIRMVRIDEPRQVCHDDYAHKRHDNDYESATPMIAGGVLGAILGNQFGKGNGKTVMTVAGAVLGGSIGRDFGHDNRAGRKNTDYYCETVNDYREEERVEGYRVAYRYHGKKFHTTLPYDPGERLRVNVSVSPAE